MQVFVEKSNLRKFAEVNGIKVPKLLVSDPKPVDLILGKVKWNVSFMEACRCAMCKCYYNLGLGVKSQSRPEIAGSYQNWPQSSLRRDSYGGRDTDLRFRGRNSSVFCPTPNTITL